jgi:hypothetical protein
MLPQAEVFGRVLVGRVVATSHMTTAQAQAQMHPPATSLKAFLTTFGRAWDDVTHVVEMCAQLDYWASHYEPPRGSPVMAPLIPARNTSTSIVPSWRTPFT